MCSRRTKVVLNISKIDNIYLIDFKIIWSETNHLYLLGSGIIYSKVICNSQNFYFQTSHRVRNGQIPQLQTSIAQW